MLYSEQLSSFEQEIQDSRSRSHDSEVVSRIWERDYKLWKQTPDEIANRLGWLDLPQSMQDKLIHIERFSKEIRNSGFTDVVVLGMGGSSLCCEVFSNIFGPGDSSYPELHVLDTTHPSLIKKLTNSLEFKSTLIVVSTKSGTTLETTSLMKFFYRQYVNKLGKESAGSHFIAITDPGTKLEELSAELNFRKVFINNPEIGGRFSVLSYFGLVPASLMGVDISKLLRSANSAYSLARIEQLSGKESNTSASMGIALGTLAKNKVNKMYVVTSAGLKSFNDWLEQLVAESTGKEGKSILPIYESSFRDQHYYGKNAFFLFIGFKDDESVQQYFRSATGINHPSFNLAIEDKYDLGALFFFMEFAVAVAGYEMGINPFDQPNVEDTKIQTKRLVETYIRNGSLEEQEHDFEQTGIIFRDSYEFGGPAGFTSWLTNIIENEGKEYVCLQAFLEPSEEIESGLSELKDSIERKYGVPVITGFGPRYLHSTGQLHKGDAGKGIFIQITSDIDQDLDIPESTGSDDSHLTFGVLITAQSLGDYVALREINRDTLRIHLAGQPARKLEVLSELL